MEKIANHLSTFKTSVKTLDMYVSERLSREKTFERIMTPPPAPVITQYMDAHTSYHHEVLFYGGLLGLSAVTLPYLAGSMFLGSFSRTDSDQHQTQHQDVNRQSMSEYLQKYADSPPCWTLPATAFFGGFALHHGTQLMYGATRSPSTDTITQIADNMYSIVSQSVSTILMAAGAVGLLYCIGTSIVSSRKKRIKSSHRIAYASKEVSEIAVSSNEVTSNEVISNEHRAHLRDDFHHGKNKGIL